MKTILNKSILIVDDDPGMLRALDKVLSGEGALVTSAEWGGDAVEILNQRRNQIDLVITDLRMPLVTGISLLRAMQSSFPSIPVIVLTAFGSPEAKAACHELGASVILEKPLDSARLLVAIGEVLDARDAQDATG
jgi:CheY-like chemotaxis protein